MALDLIDRKLIKPIEISGDGVHKVKLIGVVGEGDL
jgi:hypothetical protein